MDAESIMADHAGECGWDTDTQLSLALEYIGNQKDNDAFADFLVGKADTDFSGEPIFDL